MCFYSYDCVKYIATVIIMELHVLWYGKGQVRDSCELKVYLISTAEMQSTIYHNNYCYFMYNMCIMIMLIQCQSPIYNICRTNVCTSDFFQIILQCTCAHWLKGHPHYLYSHLILKQSEQQSSNWGGHLHMEASRKYWQHCTLYACSCLLSATEFFPLLLAIGFTSVLCFCKTMDTYTN